MEENDRSHISSNMSTEIRFFHTNSWQTEPNEAVEFIIPGGTLFMRFILYKRIGSCRFDTLGDITYDDPDILVNKGVVIDPSDFLSDRNMYTDKLNEFISSNMPDVPVDEHPDIVAKTFQAVEVAVLGLLVDIVVVNTTVRLLGCARSVEEYHKIVDRVTMGFMHISKHVAATKLSIDDLEKVTLNSLDLTMRQTPCIICREDLDHIDVVEERSEHPQMITRLPCSHLYHGDCIVKWLLMMHLCPLCRYPIPVVKVPCELPTLEVTSEGLVGEVNSDRPFVEVAGELQIIQATGEGSTVELTNEQPIVEVAGEQQVVELADERPKTSRQVDWPILLKMSAGGIIAAMLLCRLLKWK